MGPDSSGEQSPIGVPPRRAPMPRYRPSIDGVSGIPVRRPLTPTRPQSYARPAMPPRPMSAISGQQWHDIQPQRPAAPPPPQAITPPPLESQPVQPLQAVSQPQPAQFAPEQPAQPVAIPEEAVFAPSPIPLIKDFSVPPKRPVQPKLSDAEDLEAIVEAEATPKKRTKKRLRLPRIKLRKRYVIIPVAVAVVAGALGGGVYALIRWHSEQTNPVTILSSAFGNALATTQLQTTTDGPTGTKQVTADLTTLAQPIVSVQASETVAGQSVQLMGYGSVANSYVSYTGLPATIPSAITAVAKDAWVQIRTDNSATTGISQQLANLPDPRYETYGPLLFANATAKQRSSLVDFINNHTIYSYKPQQVQPSTFSGQKVLAYPVTINTSYLKILNQSLAATAGFVPSDIQYAVDQLTGITNGTLYVSTKTHRFVAMQYQQNGQYTTVKYSYTTTLSANEPQTKLTWPGFAPTEYALEAQLSTGLSAAQQDAIRTQDLASLHTALAAYQATNGFYPTVANMNDQNWVAANLTGLDPEVFRDPLGQSLAIASAPARDIYSYQVTPDSHSGACVNAGTNPCTHYTLTATLSTGKPSTVTDP